MQANGIANVAVFGGAAGEDEDRILADAVNQVAVCCAIGDSEAGSWSHGRGKASEAAVWSVSIDVVED